jgi:hypothetical protein
MLINNLYACLNDATALYAKNQALRAPNEALRAENAALRTQNETRNQWYEGIYGDTIKGLRAEIKSASDHCVGYFTESARLHALVIELRTKNAELHTQLEAAHSHGHRQDTKFQDLSTKYLELRASARLWERPKQTSCSYHTNFGKGETEEEA